MNLVSTDLLLQVLFFLLFITLGGTFFYYINLMKTLPLEQRPKLSSEFSNYRSLGLLIFWGGTFALIAINVFFDSIHQPLSATVNMIVLLILFLSIPIISTMKAIASFKRLKAAGLPLDLIRPLFLLMLFSNFLFLAVLARIFTYYYFQAPLYRF